MLVDRCLEDGEREREKLRQRLTNGVLEAACHVFTCLTKPLQSKFFREQSWQLNVNRFGPILQKKGIMSKTIPYMW